MKTKLTLALVVSFACATTVRAEDPYGKMRSTEVPKCNWSTMKSADYKNCKQTEEHFKKMTPEEREQHDKAVSSPRSDPKPPADPKKK